MDEIAEVLVDGEPVPFTQDRDGWVRFSLALPRLIGGAPSGARIEVRAQPGSVRAFDASGQQTFP